jgi:hypothetical protein
VTAHEPRTAPRESDTNESLLDSKGLVIAKQTGFKAGDERTLEEDIRGALAK